MTGFEIGMLGLTAVYVGTTIYYAVTSHRTLKAIKEESTTSAKRFSDQLTAMREAREQTDKLIEQAIAQVKATELNAQSAKFNAEALMGAERAWIMVMLYWGTGEGTGRIHHLTTSPDKKETGIYLMMTCTNQGRTPAWVDEIRARLEIVGTPSPAPDIDAMQIIRNEPAPLGVNDRLQPDPDLRLRCAGFDAPGKMTLVSGVVKYRDAFGGDRRTFFGYVITADAKLQRVAGLPEYNKYT